MKACISWCHALVSSSNKRAVLEIRICMQIFGFLFLVGILTTVITVEVSIVCTYVQLCAEDYLWWCDSPENLGPLRLASLQLYACIQCMYVCSWV